jgi:hypothetical protein
MVCEGDNSAENFRVHNPAALGESVHERDPQVCDFCTELFPVTVFQCADFVRAKDSPLPHQDRSTPVSMMMAA